MTIAESLQKSKAPYSRKNPCLAKFISCKVLNKTGSSKQNLHVVFDLEGLDLSYTVGSSFGILPENAHSSVEEILDVLELPKETKVFDSRSQMTHSLFSFLKKEANLSQITSKHIELFHKYAPDLFLEELLANDEERKAFLHEHDLFTFLEAFWTRKVPLDELIGITAPLLPRFYSIASSQKKVGSQVHFMVASFSYEKAGRQKQSITAKFVQDECIPNETQVRMFLQESPHFHLPENPETPIIMIGPGTGLAAFIGFMQERASLGSLQKQWLFTGDRERKYDFHYEEELTKHVQDNLLRLDAAFSRDSGQKVYVQDLMLKNAPDLWQWIQNGAHVYISGDASKMAKDVQATLQLIAEREGHLAPDSAKEFLKHLKAEKRLLLDVY